MTITLNRQDLIQILRKLEQNPDVDPFKIIVQDKSSTEYTVIVTTMDGERL
jgi:hypothetical protein